VKNCEKKNSTAFEAEIWELILTFLPIRDHVNLTQCGQFFKQVVDQSVSWQHLWPSHPGLLEPLQRSRKMQLKYFSDHVVKQGFVQLLSGALFSTWSEVWLVLSGCDIYAFDVTSFTLPKIRLLQNFSRLGLSRVLEVIRPIKTVSLVTRIMVHQPVEPTEQIKRFGFRGTNEEIDWFSIPQKQLERSKNWLRVLYNYSKQLRLDLALAQIQQK